MTACDSPPPHTTYVDIDGGTLTPAAGSAGTSRRSPPARPTCATVVLRVDRDAPQGPLRNLLIVTARDAASVRDSATIDVEGVTPASIPIVTG